MSDYTTFYDAVTGELLAIEEITVTGYVPRGETRPHLRQLVLFHGGCTPTAQSPHAMIGRHPRTANDAFCAICPHSTTVQGVVTVNRHR